MAASAAALAVAACGSKTACTIEGQVPDEAFYNKMVYLVDSDGKTVLDSAATDAQGHFTLKHEAAEPRMATVQTFAGDYAGGPAFYGQLAVEPGRIYMDIVNDSLSGTPLNDQLAGYLYNKERKSATETLRGLAAQLQSADQQEARDTLMQRAMALQETMMNDMRTAASNLFQDNKTNMLGGYALAELAQMEQFTLATLDSILATAGPAVAQYEAVSQLRERLRTVERTSPGHPFIDIKGHTYADSATSSLAQLIQGKVAVVDFWASWCGPCRQEITESLIPLHKKYQGKGVAVVGVDISDTPKGLAAAMQQLSIPYPVLVAEGDAGALYGINSIPQILLVDANGTILARDLRGEAIEAAVLNALDKKQ